MTIPPKPVRVRFAPSPTGSLHIGGARTALYNHLLARQTGGRFILRLEDTDRKRYVPGAEEEIIKVMHWLGLDWDEGPDVGGPHAPYRQSKRKDIYQEFARQLVSNGHAYYCFCSPERLQQVRQEKQKLKQLPRYDRTCRRLDPQQAADRVNSGDIHVIRFKTPENGTITVHDHLRGDITLENRSLDDYILVKSDGLALYHLAAMVDDHLMEITHVIRGSEWLPTFPLHAHIIRSFGWDEPVWLHLSVFLKPSGKGKMSKREAAQIGKSGRSIFVKDLEGLGYLPEAVVNWIALMGWSYDDRTEFFTMPELIEKFDIERLNPAPAAINFTKFDHFNGLHIRSLEVSDLADRIMPSLSSAGYHMDRESLLKIIPLIQKRITTLGEAADMINFLFLDVHPEPEQLVGKKMSPVESETAMREVHRVLGALPEINPETAELPLRSLADELGLKAGQLFGILRVAVTGRTVSPPLLESMAILSKTKVMERIQNAIVALESIAD